MTCLIQEKKDQCFKIALITLLWRLLLKWMIYLDVLSCDNFFRQLFSRLLHSLKLPYIVKQKCIYFLVMTYGFSTPMGIERSKSKEEK